MSPVNMIVLTGRLTRDPELRTVTGGKKLATLSLAVRRPTKSTDGQQPVDFFDVTVWETLAETCAEHLGKGRLVSVLGRLVAERWQTKAGEKRRSLAITASEVQFLEGPRQRETGAGEVAAGGA